MQKFVFRILGLVLFVYALVMVLIMNVNLGIIFYFFAGSFFIFLGFLGVVLKSIGLIVRLIFVGIIILILSSIFLISYGKNDTVTYKEDVLIILGAGIDGERVTNPLAKRLDEGVKFHEKNPTALIVVTGGQGPQEDITEALAMERYLIGKGVNPEVIIKEEQATSTYENFKYSMEILEKRLESDFTVCFATTDFHIFRASNMYSSLGYEATHVSAPSELYAIPVNCAREVMAVVKFYVMKS